VLDGVGSQYSSHYLGTWCIQNYYRCSHNSAASIRTELTSPADLNGLVRFAERRNLVSVRVIIFQTQSVFLHPLLLSIIFFALSLLLTRYA
jgi:hypothetical protein